MSVVCVSLDHKMQTLTQKEVGNTCRNRKDEFKVGRHMEFCFHGGQISENKNC